MTGILWEGREALLPDPFSLRDGRYPSITRRRAQGIGEKPLHLKKGTKRKLLPLGEGLQTIPGPEHEKASIIGRGAGLLTGSYSQDLGTESWPKTETSPA